MFLNNRILFAALLFSVTINITANAQHDKNLHLTTGIGLNSIQGKLKNTFRSTVAFNSGFEKSFAKHWYGQLEVNFNSLKYDQQAKDANSPYIFQNTSSSFFQVSFNWGYDFHFKKSPLFASLYTGSGFLSLGKPRINIDEVNNIATQTIIRGNGIFGRGGGRFGVNTRSALFQTIYFDGSWLTSSVKTEGTRFKNIAVFIGMRMEMGNQAKEVTKQMKSFRGVL